MKFPSENDFPGESASKENELDELQRMVRENELALKRANKMIEDLRKHLGTDRAMPSPKPRREK